MSADVAYWQQRVRDLTRQRDQALSDRLRHERALEQLTQLADDLKRLGAGAEHAASDIRSTVRAWAWEGPYSDLLRDRAGDHRRRVADAVAELGAARGRVRADRRTSEDALASLALKLRSIEYELAVARRGAAS